MAFPQQTISLQQGFGVPGELFNDGPVRSAPWELISTPATNVVGARACTYVSAGVAAAGGTGIFVGIIANPKVYANFNASLAPTLTLPDHTIAELITMGTLLATLTTASNPGDFVVFDTTTGALSVVPSTISFTASFATNVMTVTVAPTAGSIGPGSLITSAGVAPGTIVLSGTGPYTLSTSPGTITAQAATASGGSYAGSGKLYVPRTKTILVPGSAAATAIIELTD